MKKDQTLLLIHKSCIRVVTAFVMLLKKIHDRKETKEKRVYIDKDKIK